MPVENTLKKQGFSDEEIRDVYMMASCIETYFSKANQKINYIVIATFEAERLTQMGISEKVRNLALRVTKTLSRFS